MDEHNEEILGIEVKYSDGLGGISLQAMDYLKELSGDKFIGGWILYRGAKVVPLKDDIFAVPVKYLWEPMITTRSNA